MAVITNNWTQQAPLAASGVTGVQSIAHIPACRVFLKAPDSTTAAPVNTMAAYGMKTNGTVPASWTDTGIMTATGQVTYTKTLKSVMTGIDKIERLTYVESRTAKIDFELSQLDDTVLAQLGFINSVITAASTVNFQLGQEDVINKALLMVYANKADGKEIQWYHPSAQLSATLANNAGQTTVKVEARLIAFQPLGYTLSSLISATVFA
jgi:hypothetical protein